MSKETKTTEMKTVIQLLLVITLCFSVTTPIFAKPAPSIKVDMNWVNPPVENQQAEIHIRLVSHISTDQLKMNIIVPDGIQVISGEINRIMQIKKGEAKHVRVEVFIEEKAKGDIHTKVTIGSPDDSYFSASDSLTVDFSGETSLLKARERSTPTYQRTEREGVGLREYRLSH